MYACCSFATKRVQIVTIAFRLDYKHLTTLKFFEELDMELFEAVNKQQPQHLSKYVGLTLDKMHVKEGLFLTNILVH